MGQILSAGQQNPARRRTSTWFAAGKRRMGINQLCGSGLRAVAIGAQHVMLGDADIVVAGGQEKAWHRT